MNLFSFSFRFFFSVVYGYPVFVSSSAFCDITCHHNEPLMKIKRAVDKRQIYGRRLNEREKESGKIEKSPTKKVSWHRLTLFFHLASSPPKSGDFSTQKKSLFQAVVYLHFSGFMRHKITNCIVFDRELNGVVSITWNENETDRKNENQLISSETSVCCRTMRERRIIKMRCASTINFVTTLWAYKMQHRINWCQRKMK